MPPHEERVLEKMTTLHEQQLQLYQLTSRQIHQLRLALIVIAVFSLVLAATVVVGFSVLLGGP